MGRSRQKAWSPAPPTQQPPGKQPGPEVEKPRPSSWPRGAPGSGWPLLPWGPRVAKAEGGLGGGPKLGSTLAVLSGRAGFAPGQAGLLGGHEVRCPRSGGGLWTVFGFPGNKPHALAVLLPCSMTPRCPHTAVALPCQGLASALQGCGGEGGQASPGHGGSRAGLSLTLRAEEASGVTGLLSGRLAKSCPPGQCLLPGKHARPREHQSWLRARSTWPTVETSMQHPGALGQGLPQDPQQAGTHTKGPPGKAGARFVSPWQPWATKSGCGWLVTLLEDSWPGKGAAACPEQRLSGAGAAAVWDEKEPRTFPFIFSGAATEQLPAGLGPTQEATGSTPAHPLASLAPPTAWVGGRANGEGGSAELECWRGGGAEASTSLGKVGQLPQAGAGFELAPAPRLSSAQHVLLLPPVMAAPIASWPPLGWAPWQECLQQGQGQGGGLPGGLPWHNGLPRLRAAA